MNLALTIDFLMMMTPCNAAVFVVIPSPSTFSYEKKYVRGAQSSIYLCTGAYSLNYITRYDVTYPLCARYEFVLRAKCVLKSSHVYISGMCAGRRRDHVLRGRTAPHLTSFTATTTTFLSIFTHDANSRTNILRFGPLSPCLSLLRIPRREPGQEEGHP